MLDSDRSTSRLIGDWVLWVLRGSDLEEPYHDDEIEVGDSEAVRPFFAAALCERIKWYLLAILSTMVFTFLTIQEGVNPIQVWGLLLDLVGAFVLGVGLLRSDVGIERDSISTTEAATGLFAGSDGETHSDEYRDPLSVSSEARDTVDGLAGVSFLIVGFSLQVLVVLT